jgi:hypothetical protein
MSTQSHIDKVELKPNLMEYPHHVGAPKIVATDLTPFKRNGTDKANKIFNRRYEELLKEAETLQKSFIVTQEVYESSYKFEPIIGEIYHLYEDDNGNKYLSLIEPTSWNKTHLYSAVLNSDMTWTRLPE